MDLKLRAVFTLLSPSLRWHVLTPAWLLHDIHDQLLRGFLAVQVPAESILASLRALDETVPVVP